MGAPMPIPLSEILAYCDLYRIHDLDERHEIVTFIQAMDRTYLDRARKE